MTRPGLYPAVINGAQERSEIYLNACKTTDEVAKYFEYLESCLEILNLLLQFKEIPRICHLCLPKV